MDTTPKPSFLRGLQHQNWTVAGALSELVDNSLGSGRGDARRVLIDHDVTKRTLTVCDDGRGMDHVGRLFQLGNTIGRSVGDIGEYGSGGTMAILWLSSEVEVFTLKDGVLAKHRRNWSKQFKAESFFDVPDRWIKSTPANTPVQLLDCGSGTMIVCHLLKERSFYPQNVIRDLQNNYAPGLRSNKKIYWRTIKKGQLVDSRELSEPYPELRDSITFDFVIDTGREHLGVVGEAGIVDELPYNQSRISIGYAHRVICRTRDCYQSDADERYTGTGVCGWIDLGEGWQPYLSTTKDAINDGPIWDALMEHLYAELKPLLQKVQSTSFRILFNDLQLALQTSLNDLSDLKAEDWVEEIPVDITVCPVPAPNPESGVLPPRPEPETEGSENPGEDLEGKIPAQSQIIVVEQTDKEMSGTLCSAEIDGPDVIAQVNREHPWVEEAMKAKPVNRKALVYMIVREIASAISDRVEVQKKLFPSKMFRLLQGMEDGHRERHITRFLLDKAA